MRYLPRLVSGGEEEIISRRDSLINLALEIWTYPETNYKPKKDEERLPMILMAKTHLQTILLKDIHLLQMIITLWTLGKRCILN